VLKVIKKELILNRKVILINGIIFLACLTYFAARSTQAPPRVYAGFASFMMAFLPAVIVTREDKFNAMVLGCSLPVRRKTIVQARFVLSLAMAGGGILGALLFGAFAPFSRFAPSDLFAWGPLVTGLTGITLVLAILLPFTLRYGMKGILLFLVASQVLGVLLLTVTQVTHSELDRRIVEAIGGFFSSLHQVLGELGFNLVLVAFLGVLLLLSYLISVRVFENREL
jgi:hypothetical protein